MDRASIEQLAGPLVCLFFQHPQGHEHIIIICVSEHTVVYSSSIASFALPSDSTGWIQARLDLI
jgi:hypothetical protein